MNLIADTALAVRALIWPLVSGASERSAGVDCNPALHFVPLRHSKRAAGRGPYSSAKVLGSIAARSRLQIAGKLWDGRSVFVAMRPYEKLSRSRIAWIASAPFRMSPLRLT